MGDSRTGDLGDMKGVCPLHGDRTRGLAPFVGAGAAGLRAEPATVGGSTPLAGSSPRLRDRALFIAVSNLNVRG